MIWLDKTLEALRKAKEAAGTQKKLEIQTGFPQPRIAELLNGRRYMGKVYFASIIKLFPEIEISFFKKERPSPEAMRLAKGFDQLCPRKQEELLQALQQFQKK